ncbi:uncharacterized protein MELLADRAFT_85335 [Melampsora larici-populina 98AG31]|uniref:Uncharacterized protein n=1 Tax=Melampsora larici-populina (strain 98AG31 / pathotype 3-4-7) TaxID=747676 RepID=F4SD07_MELLP|nr:uncharacterized protein MELLADRAFT_85335 [Melampsora larici-populina 98AG31]EGF97471.1 hypothetical protein MELLADRAFT_85335 [Melampsora larici-populina 98AG31]
MFSLVILWGHDLDVKQPVFIIVSGIRIRTATFIMSDNSNPTYHAIYVSGNFEIEQKLSPNHGWRSEYRTYVTYIGCGGVDRDQRLLYEIKAKGYSSPTYMLSQNYIYYLRGSFFPSNTPETDNDQLLFEGSNANVMSACEVCQADLVDLVSVTSLGIVIGIDTIVEKCCDMLRNSPTQGEIRTTVLTIQHADYHPILKSRRVCKMEYLVRPTRALSGIVDSITVGRECHIHGYIKDFNQDTACYVVIEQHSASAATSSLEPLTGQSRKPPKFVVKKITSRADFPADKAAVELEGESVGLRNCASQLPLSPGPSGSPASTWTSPACPQGQYLRKSKSVPDITQKEVVHRFR